MRYYLSEEEMNKIELLAEYALCAHNKEDAKKYIQQIYFVISDVLGASKNILNEMIAAVENAAGTVADKINRVTIAKQLILKAKMYCVNKN